MPSWHDALDAQTNLIEFWGTEKGEQYGESFAESVEGKSFAAAGAIWQERGHAGVASWELPKLMLTEPMFVTTDVCDLIDHARESFEPESLIAEDMIVPWGFALFERGILMDDYDPPGGDGTPGYSHFRAMSWAPVRRHALPAGQGHSSAATGLRLTDDPDGAWGIVVTMYAHRDDDPLPIREEFRRGPFGAYPLMLHHYTWMEYGTPWDSMMPDKIRADNDRLRNIRANSAFVQVFFRLMQQRIAVQTREQAPRASRRRALRAGSQDRKVIVVTLRRTKRTNGYEGEPGGVDWSHRWIVGGHWHTYWHGSGDGKYTRQHWINEYIKGPDSKPLILTGKAYEFKR